MKRIEISGTCLSFHLLFGLEIRMRRIVFAGVILFCLLGDLGTCQTKPGQYCKEEVHIQDVGGLICRACNLSIPFHGCLLDLGTCQAKPGQYCIEEVHIQGGIEWYSTKGCTKNTSECFKRTLFKRTLFKGILKLHELVTTRCCNHSLCNF
ncbi:uncharacterized protein C9orf57 homolog isoform X1 [Hylobates moloch]|uniref:uncharacterized protein C9orf57 homolog isoform X1 n=1 Tax=Hylobates moloch TaxID=81572 RepID=UPI0026764B05|nr:uncharacterized protein C9orf57 homolog isoform X1 [Hylobates moloch]